MKNKIKEWLLSKFFKGMAFGIIATLIIMIFYSLGAFDILENKFLDYRYVFLRYYTRLETGSKYITAYQKIMNFLGLNPIHNASKDIVIVNIDESSIENFVPYFGRWPWPRVVHGYLCDYMGLAGAKAVGFDVLFTEPSNLEIRPSDIREILSQIENMLQDEKDVKRNLLELYNKVHSFNIDDDAGAGQFMSMYGAAYLAFTFTERIAAGEIPEHFLNAGIIPADKSVLELIPEKTGPIIPVPPLFLNAKGVGHISMSPDKDGPVRRMLLFANYERKLYPSLALKMAMDILNIEEDDIKIKPGSEITIGALTIPLDKESQALVNYYGTFGSYSYYPYYNVIADYIGMQRGETPKLLDRFKDKIVLVGSTAAGLMDLRANPFTPIYPGVEIHATLIDNILKNDFLMTLTDTQKYSVIFLIGLLVTLIAASVGPLKGFFYSLITALLYIVFSLYAFKYNLWIELFTPILTVGLVYLTIVLYRFISEEKEKTKIKNAFSHYLDGEVINQILKDPSKLKLGGEERIMTVLFSDLAGFTTISEKLNPTELVALLNEYLSRMTEVIISHSGTLDKYEGDAIMAFWGAPIYMENHAELCCRAAIDYQKALAELRKKWEGEGQVQLEARIGINTGNMLVGNMGSNMIMDYTVMGDNVNLGARLESANKEYGTHTMVSEFTYDHAKDKFEFRKLDLLRVKGKLKPVAVYELLEEKGKFTDEQKGIVDNYNKAMEFYEHRNFEEALKCFQAALDIKFDDGPSLEYVNRCIDYIENPPPPDWDGVFTLKTK